MNDLSAEQLALAALASKNASPRDAIEATVTALGVELLDSGVQIDLSEVYRDLADSIPDGLATIGMLPLVEFYCTLRRNGMDHADALSGFSQVLEALISRSSDPADALRDELALNLLSPRSTTSAQEIKERGEALCAELSTQGIAVTPKQLYDGVRSMISRGVSTIDATQAINAYGTLRKRGLAHKESVLYLKEQVKETVRVERAKLRNEASRQRLMDAVLRVAKKAMYRR